MAAVKELEFVDGSPYHSIRRELPSDLIRERFGVQQKSKIR